MNTNTVNQKVDAHTHNPNKYRFIGAMLDKISGWFFALQSIVGKGSEFIFEPISTFLRLGALILGFIANSLWFAANFLKPHHHAKKQSWYDQLKISHQIILAAITNILGIAITVAALYFSFLSPISAWLICLGTLIWAIAEYHKFKNPPPHEEKLSQEVQEAFFSYVKTSAMISLVTAVATTLIFFVPVITLPVTFFAGIIASGLAFVIIESQLKRLLSDKMTVKLTRESYADMQQTLGGENNLTARAAVENKDQNVIEDITISSPAQAINKDEVLAPDSSANTRTMIP